MPMPNSDWEAALGALQPNLGGVQNARAPGQTGNVSYAPGMMSTYERQMPLARQMAAQVQPFQGDPNFSAGSPFAPSGGGGGTGPGSYLPPPMAQAWNAGYDPAQAQGLLEALRRLILARGSVAATRGGNSYPPPGGAYGGGDVGRIAGRTY